MAEDITMNVGTAPGEWFVGMDGDDMGKTVEEALTENDLAKSQKFEKQIKSAFAEVEEYVTEHGGTVIFYGGDNLFFTIDGDPKEIGDAVREIYKKHTNHTATVGIGKKPEEAHKALVIGKNTGKDQVVIWSSEQEKVYDEIRKQQKELESCEEEIREKSDLAEVGESSGLKYRAVMHYHRLRSLGYDHQAARQLVEEYYAKEAASYRDVLKSRTETSDESKEGESKNDRVSEETPVLEQKLIAKKGVGLVRFVGRKFVSVQWLNGDRERIALSKFSDAVKQGEFTLIPKIRVAKRDNTWNR
jgi:hypothetical protein